jgi:hypothetical protein
MKQWGTGATTSGEGNVEEVTADAQATDSMHRSVVGMNDVDNRY